MEIERGDEGIEEAHGIIGGDIILQSFRKEQPLGTVQTRRDDSCLKQTRKRRRRFQMTTEFSHRLALQPTPGGVVVCNSHLSPAWLSFGVRRNHLEVC